MLNKPVDEIVLENGRVVGVKSEGEVRYTLTLNVNTHLRGIIMKTQQASQFPLNSLWTCKELGYF